VPVISAFLLYGHLVCPQRVTMGERARLSTDTECP